MQALRESGTRAGSRAPGRPSSVLLVHNRYREPGGEERVYETEADLLGRFGHRVLRYERDSAEIAGRNQAGVALRAIWSRRDHAAIGEVVRRERVEVVHFHNTFPLISPAAWHGARQSGAAVVQTLHNFRIICPGGLLLREGAPCEQCVGRTVPWPGVVHRCYRESFAATAAVATMMTVHRALRSGQQNVDAFIALSAFSRDRFIAGGLPADRLHVAGGTFEGLDGVDLDHARTAGAHFLYVGRLAQEKGIQVLLQAWQQLPGDTELRIIGDGPLQQAVAEAAERDSRITWLGRRSRAEVLQAMAGAYALVLPSICFENFPGVLVEAQAVALPVVASDLGSGAEIVRGGGFGTLFAAGDASALAGAVQQLAGSPQLRAELAMRSGESYSREHSPERSYAKLTEVYQQALRRRHAHPAAGAQSAAPDDRR